MAISKIPSIKEFAPQIPPQAVQSTKPVTSFQEILNRIGKEFSPMMKDIAQLSKQMGVTKLDLSSKSLLAPQQLLSAQMRVSELQLKTELLSKVVDSALQVTKKLQSPQ